jgi:pimeloyl-ACP methyl ester carboxylesterase
MKNSFVFRVDRQDFFTPAAIHRREFLKAGISFAAVATGLEMITGCAVTKTQRGQNAMAIQKPSSNINPPKGANYVLVHGGNMTTDTWNKLTVGNPVYIHDGKMGGMIWDTVIPALTAHNHRVFAPTLLDEYSCNLTDHIAQICALIVENDLRDVILVGHSYGGMIITGVAASMTDRISHLVYVDAALPDPGQSLFDIIVSGGCDPLSFAGLEPAAPYVEKLQYDAQKIKLLPKTYILGTKSEFAAVTRVARQKIAATEKEWTNFELPSSHVPMADMPDDLEQLLLRIAQKNK